MMIFFVRPAQYTILTTFTLTRLCSGQLFSPGMGDSHVAGKKYLIISRVVEVITSQSNEFITSGRRPRVINSLLDK